MEKAKVSNLSLTPEAQNTAVLFSPTTTLPLPFPQSAPFPFIFLFFSFFFSPPPFTHRRQPPLLRLSLHHSHHSEPSLSLSSFFLPSSSSPLGWSPSHPPLLCFWAEWPPSHHLLSSSIPDSPSRSQRPPLLPSPPIPSSLFPLLSPWSTAPLPISFFLGRRPLATTPSLLPFPHSSSSSFLSPRILPSPPFPISPFFPFLIFLSSILSPIPLFSTASLTLALLVPPATYRPPPKPRPGTPISPNPTTLEWLAVGKGRRGEGRGGRQWSG